MNGLEAERNKAVDGLKRLFDEGSFIELDAHISTLNKDGSYKDEGAGVICGYGKLEGRLVFALRQLGESGAICAAQVRKINKTIKNALSFGAPIVSFFDSPGAKLDEGAELLRSYGRLMKSYGRAKGVVPLISIILGKCNGANSMLADYADFIISLKDESSLFLLGPNEIEAYPSAAYGSAEQISESGASDIICKDETEAIESAKQLLSYLPSSRFERAPEYKTESEITVDELINDYADQIAKEEHYDMFGLIRALADDATILPVAEDYGPRAASAFVRIGGASVGVVANLRLECDERPVLDIASLDKIKRFVKICDNYNVPILSIVDVCGFKSKNETEALDLLAAQVRLSTVLSAIDVPLVSLIVGRAYGSAYLSMGVKDLCADIAFAWPEAKISAINPKTGAIVMGEKLSGIAKDIPAKREAALDAYIKNSCTSKIAAASGLIDDILEPSYTRYRLVDIFDVLKTKLSEQRLTRLGY